MIGKQFNMGNDFKQRKNNKSFQKKDNYKSFKNDDKHKFNSEDFPETSNNATDNLIIGRNPVLEALKAEKLIDTIYVNSEATGSIAHIISLAREQGIVIKNVNDTKLSSMTNGASHQGVVAVGACAEYVSVERILEIAQEKGESPFIIICDEIEDPHNLGAIIRTAEAAGAHGIIIPKRRSASLNHTVFKTSAGAASWLPVARVSNIVSAIELLKQNGVWIYGTDASGEDYTSANLTGSIGLVIGSEGNGIGRLVKEKCDFLLKLPMLGKITSLNASVAGGIFMYEIVRQRNKA
jgi:23S rRNA (guanosine2251-2'-O)-methyltransferase